MPRRKISLQESQVKQWAIAGCTLEEIADATGITRKQLHHVYKQRIDRWNSEGKKCLKMTQYAQAMGGNVQMLIWLGKQYLGQAEKLESRNNGKLEGKRINIVLQPPRKGKSIPESQLKVVGGDDLEADEE